MKLERIYLLEADLTLVTGLRIGGTNDAMQIGGVDQPVIRNPLDDLPYIPGSSLKGKMRSLMEWQTSINSDEVLKLFGSIPNVKSATTAPAASVPPSALTDSIIGRLAFYDVFLKDKDKYIDKSISRDNLFELKMETAIDRITGTAKIGSLRTIERVSAGHRFDFKIAIRAFDNERDQLIKRVLYLMRILELDSLGGSGSRGYGKIKFSNPKIGEISLTDAFAKVDPFKFDPNTFIFDPNTIEQFNLYEKQQAKSDETTQNTEVA